MWGDDSYGYDDLDFDDWFYASRYMPPPVFHTFCARCNAPVELRGPGAGMYKAYEAGEGKTGLHRCNRSASLDEFEVLTDD